MERGFLLCFQNHSNLLEEVVYGPFLDSEQFTGIGIEAYEPLEISRIPLLQSEAVLRLRYRRQSKSLERKCSIPGTSLLALELYSRGAEDRDGSISHHRGRTDKGGERVFPARRPY
jgi:hypothetical protein